MKRSVAVVLWSLVGLPLVSVVADHHQAITIIDVHPIEIEFDVASVTFEQALDEISKAVAAVDLVQPGEGVTFVLDRPHIPKRILTHEITMSAPQMPAQDILWVLCRRLGLGYRLDDHGIFISRRERTPLPEPPTRELAQVGDAGRPAGVVIVIGRDER